MIPEPIPTILSDEIVLAFYDLIDLGLDEAPDDIGPSEEDTAAGQYGGYDHG